MRRMREERRDDRQAIPALTAKSYVFQEAEGFSRDAKLDWARLRGGHTVTNLQHDGVVAELAAGVDVDTVARELTKVCTAALGYEQRVEEKPMGAGGVVPAQQPVVAAARAADLEGAARHTRRAAADDPSQPSQGEAVGGGFAGPPPQAAQYDAEVLWDVLQDVARQ